MKAAANLDSFVESIRLNVRRKSQRESIPRKKGLNHRGAKLAGSELDTIFFHGKVSEPLDHFILLYDSPSAPPLTNSRRGLGLSVGEVRLSSQSLALAGDALEFSAKLPFLVLDLNGRGGLDPVFSVLNGMPVVLLMQLRIEAL